MSTKNYPTHKNTPEAKAETLARKQVRAIKYSGAKK